jgi:hypothetical protein
MIALGFSIICFSFAIYQILNSMDIGGIIFMSSSIIWFVLYLIALNITNKTSIMKTFLLSKGGSKE